MATITDVARHAGVSIKTVSRVLNGASHVRPETEAQVRAAIEALDYQPSNAARELRSGRSRFIGMLFSNPTGGFEAKLHHAALKAASEAGVFISGGLIEGPRSHWLAQLEAFLSRSRATAMVLTPPVCDEPALHEALLSRGIDTVLVSPVRDIKGLQSVRMDDYQGALELTDHLLGLGHRRLGHLTGPDDHVASVLRHQGFMDAVNRTKGAQARPEWIQPGRFLFRDAVLAADSILAQDERPTAIFAANDETAAAVCFAAGQRGLKVPDDLSVAGFDDAPIATTVWPPLTTIAQPFDALGEVIVALLANSNRDACTPTQSRILPHALKARLSTAAPGTE